MVDLKNIAGGAEHSSKRELTPEEKKKQDQADESIVFVLAGSMIDLHIYMSLKNKAGMQSIVGKVTRILQLNLGFVGRFREAQKRIQAELQNGERRS
jgi:hypothetical protein